MALPSVAVWESSRNSDLGPSPSSPGCLDNTSLKTYGNISGFVTLGIPAMEVMNGKLCRSLWKSRYLWAGRDSPWVHPVRRGRKLHEQKNRRSIEEFWALRRDNPAVRGFGRRE